MPDSNRMRVSFKLLLAMLSAMAFSASGCSSPYRNPHIEEMGATSPSQFEGILSYAQQDDLRVVWLHGMCTHARDWAENRHTILARATGLRQFPPGKDPGRSRPYSVPFFHKVAGHDLEVRYLVWSPLADGAKSAIRISEENIDGFEPKRASLNATLKRGLINDCFSDAVIYGGSAGDPIRNWLRMQICDALGGKLNTSQRCQLGPNVDRTRTIFVAESLGSKMLSDAILSIWELADEKSQTRILARLSDVQMVFYLANQIPLLSAATYTPPKNIALLKAEAPETGLIDLLAKARAQVPKTLVAQPSAPLHFVAFSDPNDLLSYRLVKGTHVPSQVRITNIFVSNDTTYFGLLERPDTAHCGYGWNPAVIGTVAKGFHGRFEKIPVKVPYGCSF